MKKRVVILAAILACVMLGAGWFAAVSGAEKDGPVTYTTLSIDCVADKFHDEDGYYLTVVLEDWLVESYNLSYDRVSVRTKPEVYEKVFPGDDCAGVCLKISGAGEQDSLEGALKWKRSDGWEIVSVTTEDNNVIDGA